MTPRTDATAAQMSAIVPQLDKIDSHKDVLNVVRSETAAGRKCVAGYLDEVLGSWTFYGQSAALVAPAFGMSIRHELTTDFSSPIMGVADGERFHTQLVKAGIAVVPAPSVEELKLAEMTLVGRISPTITPIPTGNQSGQTHVRPQASSTPLTDELEALFDKTRGQAPNTSSIAI